MTNSVSAEDFIKLVIFACGENEHSLECLKYRLSPKMFYWWSYGFEKL